MKFHQQIIIIQLSAASEFDMCSATVGMDREGSVGQLSAGNKAIIIDDEGNRLGPNQTGEICLRVQIPFLGYFGDPELTEKSYIGEYYKTGDVGYFDEDCFLYLTGRKIEMIRRNGTLVSPTEIEDLINLLEGVARSCVVGVSDGKTRNETIFAFVQKNMNVVNFINEEEIIDHVNSKVKDSNLNIGRVHFIEAILLTPFGKVRRVEMKSIAQKLFENLS